MVKWQTLLLCLLLYGNIFSQDPNKITQEGVHLAEQGKLKEAFQCFTWAREEFRKQKNKKGQAMVINNIGRIYLMTNNVDEARKHFWHSYSIYKALNDRKSQAEMLMNIGVTYEIEEKKKGALDKSLYYFEKGYEIYLQMGDSSGMNNALINMGTVYGRKKQSRKALDAYLKALPYMERNGETLGFTTININIGTSLYELGKSEEALPYLYKAQELKANVENSVYIYRTLAKAYAELGEPDSTSRYIDLFADAREMLQNDQTTRNIEEISQKYKSQFKEEEIGRLKVGKKKDRLWLISVILGLVALVIILWLFFRNRFIKLDHQKTDLEHRILRAQMNPHFLFNCLSSIQRAYVEGDLTKANDLTADFGQLLRRILDHTSRTKISLKDELMTLNSYMEIEQIRLHNRFNFSIEVQDELDVGNIFVPPLITQPIVENAIWHGIAPLEREGNIHVECRMREDGKQLIIFVDDDGVGFLREKKKTGRTSKGIELVEKRLKAKGSLIIEPRAIGGTRVIINIPVDYEN